MGANRVCLWLLPFLGAGCVVGVEDDLSTIDEPRVLAIRAVPAEAAEGESVALEALVAGPSEVPDVAFHWCLARKPLSELGPIHPDCLQATSDALLPLGGQGAVPTLPDDACATFGPRRPDPKPGEPAGRPVDPDLTYGFYQPVLAELGGDGEFALGAVRLTCELLGLSREDVANYNRRHRPNTNVAIQRVWFRSEGQWTEWIPGGPPTVVSRATALDLRIGWEPNCPTLECAECNDEATCAEVCPLPDACTGSEHFLRLDPANNTVVVDQERLQASWYATAGEFDRPRTAPGSQGSRSVNRWRAPDRRGDVQLWIVLRDGRAGVGWWQGNLRVE